jgi:hypothetical protein
MNLLIKGKTAFNCQNVIVAMKNLLAILKIHTKAIFFQINHLNTFYKDYAKKIPNQDSKDTNARSVTIIVRMHIREGQSLEKYYSGETTFKMNVKWKVNIHDPYIHDFLNLLL